MIRCERLTKRYGDASALEGLDLSLGAGEVGGLLGLNGSGKTTTMHVLATLTFPTSGRASIAGHDVAAHPAEARARMGFLSESNVLPVPEWTPAELLSFFAARHGLSRREGDARVASLARDLDFEPRLHAPLRALSGGTRRKVLLARALLHEPDVLLLDEPTREMDIPTKLEVWRHLTAYAARGTTILLASHDALEIRRLCRTVTVLRKGRPAFSGPVPDLERRAASDGAIDAPLAALLTGGPAA